MCAIHFNPKIENMMKRIENISLKALISTLPQEEPLLSEQGAKDFKLERRIALSENVGFDDDHWEDIMQALLMDMPDELTVEYLITLHHTACKSVDDKTGKLRKNLGMTMTHVFPGPQRIPGLMETLVNEYNDTPADFRRSVQFASMFIMKLLQIHPYEYANGITAKILFVKLTGFNTALDKDHREYVRCLVQEDTVGFFQYCSKCCLCE
jgi:hypothetical protein